MAYEHKTPRHGDRWGNWLLDAETLQLLYLTDENLKSYIDSQDTCDEYSLEDCSQDAIDLERMRTGASMLDWIFRSQGQVEARLITPKDLSDLIEALNKIMHPQANLCSFGMNKRLDTTKYLRRFLPWPPRPPRGSRAARLLHLMEKS